MHFTRILLSGVLIVEIQTEQKVTVDEGLINGEIGLLIGKELVVIRLNSHRIGESTVQIEQTYSE